MAHVPTWVGLALLQSMAVTGMAAPATPAPPAAAAPSPSAENAATLYNQAFALLPQDRDNPDLKAIAEAPDGPVDATTAALIRKPDRTAQLVRGSGRTQLRLGPPAAKGRNSSYRI